MTAPRKRTRGGVSVPPPRVAGALAELRQEELSQVAYGHVRHLPDGDVLLQAQVNVDEPAGQVGELVSLRLSRGLAAALGAQLGRAGSARRPGA